MEAYESWSEGSTDVEGCVSSSEPEVSDKSTSDTELEAVLEEDSTCNSSVGESDLEAAELASSTDAPSILSRSAFPGQGGSEDSDAEEELWGMEVDAQLDALYGRPLGKTYNDMRSPNTRKPTALLTALQYDDNLTPSCSSIRALCDPCCMTLRRLFIPRSRWSSGHWVGGIFCSRMLPPRRTLRVRLLHIVSKRLFLCLSPTDFSKAPVLTLRSLPSRGFTRSARYTSRGRSALQE